MLITGRCHCGNISFSVALKTGSTEIVARACTCSFCVRHGGVWTSFPDARLTVRLQQPERVSAYRFGTGTALFHVCSVCGVVAVVTSEIAGQTYAVVNVNAMDDVDAMKVRRDSVTFDGEAEEARLARRARHWIADVIIVSGHS